MNIYGHTYRMAERFGLPTKKFILVLWDEGKERLVVEVNGPTEFGIGFCRDIEDLPELLMTLLELVEQSELLINELLMKLISSLSVELILGRKFFRWNKIANLIKKGTKDCFQ